MAGQKGPIVSYPAASIEYVLDAEVVGIVVELSAESVCSDRIEASIPVDEEVGSDVQAHPAARFKGYIHYAGSSRTYPEVIEKAHSEDERLSLSVKCEEALGRNGSVRREEKSGQSQRFTVKVKTIGESRCVCIVDFKGIPLETTFPASVIKAHNLKVDDEFEWVKSDGYEIKPEDCRPIRKSHTWSDEEKKELLEFFQEAATIHKSRRKLL